jgi:type II secretory pathway predicted ATPase ExeA
MTAEETSSYISHHLKLAGRSDTLFSDDALALIHLSGSRTLHTRPELRF